MTTSPRVALSRAASPSSPEPPAGSARRSPPRSAAQRRAADPQRPPRAGAAGGRRPSSAPRAVVADLAVRTDVDHPDRPGRRGRHRDRQRGAARQRSARRAHPRRDRPHARGQPALPDHHGPGALGPGWRPAAAARSCSSARCRARSAGPSSSLYSATKFGLRGFALALRQDLAAAGVGVSLDLARLHPRRRHVPPTPGCGCRPGPGTRTPGRCRRGGAARDRAGPRRARGRPGAAAGRRRDRLARPGAGRARQPPAWAPTGSPTIWPSASAISASRVAGAGPRGVPAASSASGWDRRRCR